MWKFFGVTTTTALAFVGGFALLSFSPLSCGCVGPKQHLADVAGLAYGDLRTLESYDARDYEAGINKNLRGKLVTPGDGHRYFLDCTPTSRVQFTCKEFTDESHFLKRGYEITVYTDENAVFKSASVKATWAWL
jgi:hypothetical protein